MVGSDTTRYYIFKICILRNSKGVQENPLFSFSFPLHEGTNRSLAFSTPIDRTHTLVPVPPRPLLIVVCRCRRVSLLQSSLSVVPCPLASSRPSVRVWTATRMRDGGTAASTPLIHAPPRLHLFKSLNVPLFYYSSRWVRPIGFRLKPKPCQNFVSPRSSLALQMLFLLPYGRKVSFDFAPIAT